MALTLTDDQGANGVEKREVTVPGGPPGGGQVPGDVGQDARLDFADAVALLRHLFAGGAAPPCGGTSLADGGNRMLADSNGDAAVDMADAIYLLLYLFQGGPRPALGTGCIWMDGCPDLCDV